MEDGEAAVSWLRRAKFSNTVYYRLDSSRTPPTPPQNNYRLEVSLTMPVMRDADRSLKGLRHSSSLPVARPSDLFGDGDMPSCSFSPQKPLGSPIRPTRNSRTPIMERGEDESRWFRRNGKRNSRSQTPVPAGAFLEAWSSRRRFATPPPRRRELDHPSNAHDHHRTVISSSSPADSTTDKQRGQKDNSWTRRYFDHCGAKVTSVDSFGEVDLSKLYLGFRFASGAHSRLYRGVYKDEPVAVKIVRQPDGDENRQLSVRLEKQYDREVSCLSLLYHRNVIKLAVAFKNPPILCIITEYLSGGSLRSFLNKLEHNPVALPKLVTIGLDIARGMEYIHSHGIIHRDLKPENILFDENCCIKVADFGIACSEASCSDLLSAEPGTYRWMAPEMIKHKPYGRKVDVYSFGLLLWEMVSGKIPYEKMTPEQAAFAVVDKNLRPEVPGECPRALSSLIQQCWASQPEKRPEFVQIVKALEKFESALAQHGSLDAVKYSTCQDQKHVLADWMHKLKLSNADDPKFPVVFSRFQ